MKRYLAPLLLLTIPTGAAAQTRVHIDSNNKSARLERAVPSYDARGRLKTHWTAVCAAPCDQVVWSSVEYRIAGEGMRTSHRFTVWGADAKLKVAAGSTGSFIGGLVLVGVGGGIMVGTAFFTALSTLTTGTDPKNGAVYALIGTGAAIAVVGGVLLLTSSTRVTSSNLEFAGLRFTARGIEF